MDYGEIIKKIESAEYYYRRDPNKSTVYLTSEEVIITNNNFSDIFELGCKASWSFRYQMGYIIIDSFYINSELFRELDSSGKLCVEITDLLYREGIFFSQKSHYLMASNSEISSDLRVIATRNINDEELLKSLLKSKCPKVRAEAYRSLGIEGNIDAISKDRCKEVREIGIDYLPFGSPDLKKFLERERASQNLIKLAKK